MWSLHVCVQVNFELSGLSWGTQGQLWVKDGAVGGMRFLSVLTCFHDLGLELEMYDKH